MKIKNIAGAAILSAMALAAACSGPKGWSVQGTIADAKPGSKLAIEAYNAGIWYVLDSVEVKPNGSFYYHAAEPMPGADILRVSLPDAGSVCFPVEGADAVTINAKAATIATKHNIGGTALAEAVSAVDSIAANTPDRADLQRKLTGIIASDTTGIIAYYTVGKAVAGAPVFDPAESYGNRVYGAAAQVYAHYHPDDVRGQVIKQMYFDGRRALGKMPAAEAVEIEAPEYGVIEIERYDNRGERRSLAEIASQGKVVLLSFTAYDTQFSPAYNAILNDLYTLYKDKGLEIYQIAFDQNEVQWKETAVNLPWITVWNSPNDGVAPLTSYNVGALPVAYIIDRKGTIAKRINGAADLPKELAKYF